MLNYIIWNPDLVALHMGPVQIRRYSLCWLIGLMLAYLAVKKLYREQRLSDEQFEPLFFYCFVGILLGARLGHCCFNQPEYFLTSWKGVFEMFVPVRLMGSGVVDSLTSGQWHFIGYEGLASHGGTFGIIVALLLYGKLMKVRMWHVLDDISIATGITACFIRLGNLMNSEIIGRPTDVPWAFIFERVDMQPRHPGQLYEAIAYGLLFLLMWHLRKPLAKKIGTGFFFGLCLTYIFTFRFLIEWTKDIQEAFEADMLLNMGQLLSIPFIIIGAVCMYRGWKIKN